MTPSFLYAKTAWLWFLIAAIMGLLLRWQFVLPTAGLNYKFFLHGHSHLMLLGWLFNAVLALYTIAFIPTRLRSHQKYYWFFGLFQLSVLGMMICFPIQGYKAFSIAFSSLHIFVSYAFVYVFWRDSRAVVPKGNIAYHFVGWAWFFHLISTLGPFALGIIMAKNLNTGHLYELAIYYYLHFQYNGLFIFAILGIFFWLLNQHSIPYDQQKAGYFLRLMIFSCIPAYALSTLWTQPPLWVYVLAWVAASLQMLALAVGGKLVWEIRAYLQQQLKPWAYRLFFLAAMAFALKHFLQFLSAFESLAMLAYQFRNITIAYLHLVFLACLSLFLLAAFIQQGWIDMQARRSRWGVILLLVGIISSELLLLLQLPFLQYEAYLPDYYLCVWGASLFLPVGLGLLVVRK